MEMDAYKDSVDRAENAKEMLDENVREYMGNVQEKVSAREKSRDGREEKNTTYTVKELCKSDFKGKLKMEVQ